MSKFKLNERFIKIKFIGRIHLGTEKIKCQWQNWTWINEWKAIREGSELKCKSKRVKSENWQKRVGIMNQK